MITIEIIGARECVQRIKALTPAIREQLVKVVTALGFQLVGRVQSNRLSGQSLHVRTGTLRRSIKSRVEEGPTSVTGIVYTPVVYAPIHEFGFSGVVTVKEHLRRVASNKFISGANAFMVRSHTRRMNMPKRAFMQPELELMAPEIRKELVKAARNTAKQKWEATR